MRVASTSLEALFALRAEGGVLRQHQIIVNFLRALPSASLSRNDISHALNIPLQSVCGRVRTLLDDGLLVEDEQTRKCPWTGRSVRPVRIAPDLFATLH
ncbi:MAG: hypothetical protein JWP44_4376 [Mucilaginibacter sp.]|nr:hypothetical protein [Mucilaginibacter sp.]